MRYDFHHKNLNIILKCKFTGHDLSVIASLVYINVMAVMFSGLASWHGKITLSRQ